MPEAGYHGEYDRKEAHYLVKKGSVADMIHDSSMLWGWGFDKVIPDFEQLKQEAEQDGKVHGNYG